MAVKNMMVHVQMVKELQDPEKTHTETDRGRSEQGHQFEDFYHDLCHDLSVFIQLLLCKKKMKTITGCLLQSGVCQRPTLCIMLHLWNLETDDL